MLYSTVATLLAVVGPALAIPAPRPDGPTDGRETVTLVGDGSPKQRYFYKQVLEPLSCGDDDSCSAGQSKTYSISVSASLGSGGGAKNWINGGFGVSESWGTTETDTCSGKKGDTVCLWYAVAHTAYKVEVCSLATGCVDEVIQSPNNNNEGGGYLCGKNDQCKTKGDTFWKDGPDGGPQEHQSTLDPSNLP